jgi:aldose 1-epimerase
LGFDTRGLYIKSFDLDAPYFGATIGRFAGRINDSEFALNGEPIHLKRIIIIILYMEEQRF